MLALQPIHIIVIVLVALLFFAPSRMPLVGRGFAKMISEFRREVSSGGKQVLRDDEKSNLPKRN